jgi:uncharacterized protein YfbU (UPF0304 family)
MTEDAQAFSIMERLFLANQYRILEQVDPDNAVEHARRAEILESGFEGQYRTIMNRFEENRLSGEDCAFVEDILVMCSWLQDHKGMSNLDVSEFEQVGFDANNEWEHLRYASFLFKDHPQGYPGIKGVVDVHRPTLGRYRRMVDAWRQAQNMPNLTEADIARILTTGGNFN